MPQQWSMDWWFDESAPMYPYLLNALTLPLKHPTAAALITDLNAFKLKEPQMSDEQEPNRPTDERLAVENFAGSRDSKVMKIAESVNALIEETEFSEATSKELGRALDQNAVLTAHLANQRATIENYQGRILELEQQVDPTGPSVEHLKARLDRALHTQKILERDLEEYQQAYAELKAETFENIPDEQLPPRLLELGHGEYLVYPAKVCLEDDDQDPTWGIVVDPTTDVDVEEYLKPLAGKDVVLTDGDVAITFQKPEDVTRLIHTLEDLRYRWFAGMFGAQEK